MIFSNNTRSLAISIIILVCLLTLSILAFQRYHHDYKTRWVKSPGTPDAILKNISARTYRLDGSLQSRFEATQLTHFSTKNHSLFNQPDVWLYQNNQSPWHIRANEGAAWGGAKLIELKNKVRLTQAPSQSKPGNQIKTTQLNYLLHYQFAYTLAPIDFSQTGLAVNAIGMRAYLKQDRVQLLSKAKAVYINQNKGQNNE